jgi:hypothetical protein
MQARRLPAERRLEIKDAPASSSTSGGTPSGQH